MHNSPLCLSRGKFSHNSRGIRLLNVKLGSGAHQQELTRGRGQSAVLSCAPYTSEYLTFSVCVHHSQDRAHQEFTPNRQAEVPLPPPTLSASPSFDSAHFGSSAHITLYSMDGLVQPIDQLRGRVFPFTSLPESKLDKNTGQQESLPEGLLTRHERIHATSDPSEASNPPYIVVRDTSVRSEPHVQDGQLATSIASRHPCLAELSAPEMEHEDVTCVSAEHPSVSSIFCDALGTARRAAKATKADQGSTATMEESPSATTGRQDTQTAALLSVANVNHSETTAATTVSARAPAQPYTASPVIGKPFINVLPPVQVRCHARTRIPTPHGEVFIHIYKNNHDAKEHIALVVDSVQSDTAPRAEMAGCSAPLQMPLPHKLHSRTLNEAWSSSETSLDRIVRGAYVGRLGPGHQQASKVPLGPSACEGDRASPTEHALAPLVRIHSECYTGETIGSQRCDCGEQLDEAIRLICDSGKDYADGHARGVVVYLRQEGRGIGLLDKVMAYNLQDMGADTVAANTLLGHLPDARQYDVASAMLRDLGVDSCRLLTNNPEKMSALRDTGVHVIQRVPMVPRMWQQRHRTQKRRPDRRRRRHRHRQYDDSGHTFHRAESNLLGQTPSLSPAPSLVVSETSETDHVATPLALDDPAAGDGLAPSGGMARAVPSAISPTLALEVATEESSDGDSDDGSGGDNGGTRGDDGDGDGGPARRGSASTSTSSSSDGCGGGSEERYLEYALRRSGLTLMGGGMTRGPELDKYLRTKVQRMGHLLDLPPPASSGDAGAAEHGASSGGASTGAAAATCPTSACPLLDPLAPTHDSGALFQAVRFNGARECP